MSTDSSSFAEIVHPLVVGSGLADYASIISLFVGFVGFAVTIFASLRSLRHSKNAENLVISMRSDLKRNATIHDFARIVALMEDLKRMHREKTLEGLPERYSSLRVALIGVRADNSLLGEEDQKAIQGAISMLSSLERDFDAHRVNGHDFNVAKINASINRHIDRVHEVVIVLRDKVTK